MLLIAIAACRLVRLLEGAIGAQLAELTGGQTAAALEGMIASASSFDFVEGDWAPCRFRDVSFASATGAIIELQDNLNIIWKAKWRDDTFGMGGVCSRTRLLSLTLVVVF